MSGIPCERCPSCDKMKYSASKNPDGLCDECRGNPASKPTATTPRTDAAHAKAGMDYAQDAYDEAWHFARQLERDLATLTRQRDGLVEAVEEVASKSTCECWDVPAMGSGLPYRWKGCKVHHSTDPEEWCLCCVAHAALAAARKEQG